MTNVMLLIAINNNNNNKNNNTKSNEYVEKIIYLKICYK